MNDCDVAVMPSPSLPDRYIPRKLPDNVIDDGLLLPNTTVIKMTSRIQEDELVYVSFFNNVSQQQHQLSSTKLKLCGFCL